MIKLYKNLEKSALKSKKINKKLHFLQFFYYFLIINLLFLF